MTSSRLNLTSTPQLEESCTCQQSQALDIAYEMAYGLSHELNNPLANIAGRARLLAEQEADPEKRQQLAIIVDQAMRGCEMIADLMLFARPPAWKPIDVELRGTVIELCERAKCVPKVVSALVTLDVDVDSSVVLPAIKADKQALAEALWAVLRNALEAAQSVVHVRLAREAAGQLIQITDDGPGLSEPALQSAFHPYFSGREAGRGLGLGLSKAQRIVQLCGGSISLKNIAPNGCQVTICLA